MVLNIYRIDYTTVMVDDDGELLELQDTRRIAIEGDARDAMNAIEAEQRGREESYTDEDDGNRKVCTKFDSITFNAVELLCTAEVLDTVAA